MPGNAAAIAFGAGAGLLAGWVLRSLLPLRRGVFSLRRSRIGSGVSTSSTNFSDYEDTSDDESVEYLDDGDYKLVLVIRTDLKMGKGKIAAQCCHAACGSVKRLTRSNPDLIRMWECCGQPKVVTKCSGEAALHELVAKANSIGLSSCLIRDAGKTQIAPGSVTALAVGPGPNHKVDQVTGHLKLL